jgi:hypothetical protein
MKFKIGDIITNGKVTFRIEDFGKNCLGYYYKLVNVDTEKKGLRYLKLSDGSNFGETGWLCEQVDELFHLVQDKQQDNIIQNITINLHSTMEKVYTLTSVWNNGEHFEGEIATTVYANKALATSVLLAKSQEAIQQLLKRYDEEDINVEMREDYIMVEADNYTDYWEGTIVEQTVIGER